MPEAVETIEQRVTIPAAPNRVYEAYVEGTRHAAFTGSPATSDPQVGGAMTAWDGYILGKWLELDPGRKIVQEWSTTRWPDGSPPSIIEITLLPGEAGGTELHFLQTEVPASQANDYSAGWHSHYWDPMLSFFAG